MSCGYHTRFLGTSQVLEILWYLLPYVNHMYHNSSSVAKTVFLLLDIPSPSTPFYPFLSLPCTLSKAISWRHNTSARMHTHLDLCNFTWQCARVHTDACTHMHKYVHWLSLSSTLTNNFTCSYCSLWPVMELTHCLFWSVWNHCLTSLVEMSDRVGGWGM